MKRVSRGETIRITLCDVPIAKLVPDGDDEQASAAEPVEDIRQLRRGIKLGKIKVRELINEGRG